MNFEDLRPMVEQNKEVETIFTRSLYALLKEKVKGHVYVKIDDGDTVYVSIRAYDIKYEYSQHLCGSIIEYISQNNNAVYSIYRDIMSGYTRFINRRFFVTTKEKKNENI